MLVSNGWYYKLCLLPICNYGIWKIDGVSTLQMKVTAGGF